MSMAMVVLVHQPVRAQRCTLDAGSGLTSACEDRRGWDWPAASSMGAAAVVGALAVAALALPFVDRR